MKELSKRKHIRLVGYDYSQKGYYFITICSFQRELLFGDVLVEHGLIFCRLSSIGDVILREIEDIENRFNNIRIIKFIIMPNHVHMIVSIDAEQNKYNSCNTIGDLVRVLKSRTTINVNKNDSLEGRKIWQYRYHDHIIRNEEEYHKIYQYIENNPQRWNEDLYYLNA